MFKAIKEFFVGTPKVEEKPAECPYKAEIVPAGTEATMAAPAPVVEAVPAPEPVIEEIKYVQENLNTKKIYTFKQYSEDAAAPIANNAGSPGVAGFTPDTLGVPKGQQPPLLKRKKVIKNV